MIAFHSYQLGQRGTEIHMFKNAKYNEEILGNKSIIVSTSSRPTPTLPMFQSRFETVLYPEVWKNDGKNDELRGAMERICDAHAVSHFWAIKGGENDGFMPNNAKQFAHCVFNMREPHGNVYAGICKYISNKHGGEFPYVYPIVENEAPQVTDDLRGPLGIPSDALVLGRHGGYDTFSLPFVKSSISKVLDYRSDMHFVFMNTERFTHHERVHHLEYSSSFEDKGRFINTCDMMMHARNEGEIFSLSIAEFSVRNKPVLTWKPAQIPYHYDVGHFDILGDNAYYYSDASSLENFLMNISLSDISGKDWNVYQNLYSPEKVMRDFEELFLN